MKVGDVVKFMPEKDALVVGNMKDRRRVGTILGIDTYQGRFDNEPILEVFGAQALWTGFFSVEWR